jgi:hypothetical protein
VRKAQGGNPGLSLTEKEQQAMAKCHRTSHRVNQGRRLPAGLTAFRWHHDQFVISRVGQAPPRRSLLSEQWQAIQLCVADLEARARLSDRVVISGRLARTLAQYLRQRLGNPRRA